MMLKERLTALVQTAPPGTLIPIEGLAALLDHTEEEAADLAADEVGRLAAQRFGRQEPYSPAAIRRWIRSGLRGVRLPAYPSGRGYRVQRSDFERFVSEVRSQKKGARPPLMLMPAAEPEDDLVGELQRGRRAYAASST
jgi:hypothetical protein